jgi:hypothetical protein
MLALLGGHLILHVSGIRVKQVKELKKITFLKRAATFSARELKRDEKKVAEEYYWAMTQAAGRSCYSV